MKTNTPPVSQDPQAVSLAQAHQVDIVISSSALVTLVHSTVEQNVHWAIPVSVVTGEFFFFVLFFVVVTRCCPTPLHYCHCLSASEQMRPPRRQLFISTRHFHR